MSPDDSNGPKQFHFVNINVTRTLFELLDNTAATGVIGPPGQSIVVGLEIGASVQLASDARSAFVRLDTRVLPDTKFQPYKIEVTLGAIFTSQDATAEQVIEFCRVAGPTILFPYVREIVHRLTMDAPHGPVRLDPVNVSQMLNTSAWEVVRPSTPSEPPSNH